MLLTFVLPLTLAAALTTDFAENVLVEYQDLPAGVAPFAPGEEAWIKNTTEYFVVTDVTTPKVKSGDQRPNIVFAAELRFTDTYENSVFDETDDRHLFKLILSKSSSAGYGTIGILRQEVPSGQRKLVYIVRNTRTTFEKRFDKSQNKYLTRSHTNYWHGIHSTMIREGQSYDPRTGKVYTGKDLDIPRWPGKPVEKIGRKQAP